MIPDVSLHVRHSSRPDTEVQLFPQPDRSEGFIREDEPYVLVARGGRDVTQSDLYVEGERLTALRSPTSGEARWQWNPGFYAGEVMLELVLPGREPVTVTAITDPARRKLTQEQYRLMVTEIMADSLALLSLAGHRISLGHGSASPVPPVARLEWFRSRTGEIVQAVERIDERPATALAARSRPVPVSRARDIRAREMNEGYRTGQLRRLPGGHRLSRAGSVTHLPEQIRKQERVPKTDIPEHRQIKTALRNWASWLSAVSDALAEDAERPGKVGSRARVWSQRCRRMARRLRSLRELPTFAPVPEAHGGVRLTSRFRNVRRYRRFYRLHQDLRRAASNVFGDQVDVPLSETYRLYEFWAYLKTVRSLAEDRGIAPGGLEDLLATDDSSGSFWFRTGQLSVRLGDGTSVAYKESFRPYWETGAGVGSYSRPMYPDIVVTTHGEEGGGTDRIVLDAKYRVGADLNDAVTSAHAYRDALLHAGEGAGTRRRALSGVYLLSPHSPDSWEDWREAPMPDRLFQRDYRRRFRFGAVEFRPGMDSETVRGKLMELVASQTCR